jgi:hypothetical protein
VYVIAEKKPEIVTDNLMLISPVHVAYMIGNETGDLLAEFHNVLNRQRNTSCQLLNVHRVNNIR